MDNNEYLDAIFHMKDLQFMHGEAQFMALMALYASDDSAWLRWNLELRKLSVAIHHRTYYKDKANDWNFIFRLCCRCINLQRRVRIKVPYGSEHGTYLNAIT